MAIFASLSWAATLHAAVTYYVSQSTGNDANDGIHAPWKTLAKASQVTFKPGDRVLLRCGDRWTQGLELKGNGSTAHPAVVSCYGTGPRPVIDRHDPTMASMKRCVYLNGNAFGWKIMNLELANAARGIEATATHAAKSVSPALLSPHQRDIEDTVAHSRKSFLWFENLDIHGCKFGKRFDRDSGDQNKMQNGLRLEASSRLGTVSIAACAFRDNFVGASVSACCDIKDCLFEHNEWTGLWYVSTRGGRISGNKFLHNCDQFVWCGVSASALGYVTNCVVEDNEFGETQVVSGAVDGEDLDFEAGCDGVILRHNLFHDSAGPASMLYNGASHDKPNTGLAIFDNVFFNAALKPSTTHYNCTFLLSDGSFGGITNNRIYSRKGVPVFAGNPCPGVSRTPNIELDTDNIPSNTNQVRAAAVSTSSNNVDSAKAQDDDPATAWTGTGTSNQWIQIDFDRRRKLDAFLVEQAAGSSIDNFVLQSWDGEGWKDIFASYSPMGSRKFMPVLPVSTSRVRLLIHSTANGAPAIGEFKAFYAKRPPR